MIIALQPHGRLAHLAEGLKQHGETVAVLNPDEDQRTHPNADLHIFWGYRAYLDSRLPPGRPYLIADKGFVRRPSIMLALSGEWGGLANWPDVPPRKVKIAEWQWSASRIALVIGQEPRDFSTLAAVRNFNQWKFEITNELQSAEWEVRFREHPRNLFDAPRDVPRPVPLMEDLRDVGLVVGLNSGALVESFLAGYAVHAADPHSLVHPFSVELRDTDQSEPEGRQAFADQLAGLSWTYAELADGRAWEAIREQALTPPTPEAVPESDPPRSARKASQRKAANG